VPWLLGAPADSRCRWIGVFPTAHTSPNMIHSLLIPVSPLSTLRSKQSTDSRPSRLCRKDLPPGHSHPQNNPPPRQRGSERATSAFTSFLTFSLLTALGVGHDHGLAVRSQKGKGQHRRTTCRPRCITRSCLFAESIRLKSQFDDTCVRRNCHWLSSIKDKLR
jgi:hypothetical protein